MLAKLNIRNVNIRTNYTKFNLLDSIFKLDAELIDKYQLVINNIFLKLSN